MPPLSFLDKLANNLPESNLKKQPFEKNKSGYDSKRSIHINNVSVCLTEENNHVNKVNPMSLADKDWTDEYKLQKLMAQQKKNAYLANQIFDNQCWSVMGNGMDKNRG